MQSIGLPRQRRAGSRPGSRNARRHGAAVQSRCSGARRHRPRGGHQRLHPAQQLRRLHDEDHPAEDVVSLRAQGDYSLEIHDVTADIAGGELRLPRAPDPAPIPHLGKVEVEQERINLAPGAAKQISVANRARRKLRGLGCPDRGRIASRCAGVAGSEAEEDKPPLMNGGKVERYFPKKQKSVLLLMAAPDAPLSSMPQVATRGGATDRRRQSLASRRYRTRARYGRRKHPQTRRAARAAGSKP